MGLHHRKYASFSRQTLFLRLVNVFSGPCYPAAYECSVPEAPVLASPVSLTGSPAARPASSCGTRHGCDSHGRQPSNMDIEKSPGHR